MTIFLYIYYYNDTYIIKSNYFMMFCFCQFIFTIFIGIFMKTTKELLAIRLKQLRKSRGLTQDKLAELIGRDTKHISKLEIAGSYPSIETLDRIAVALNVEIKEFFNFDGLKDANYIKEEFKKMLKYSDETHLQLLYKIHNDIINL